MAAVLAVQASRGPDRARVFLSHRAAAALWGLIPTTGGPIDVTLAGRSGRARRAGIRIHRPRRLSDDSTTHRFRIPVTTVARTIADLRRAPEDTGGAGATLLRRVIRQAEVAGYATGLERSDRTRSELERRFLLLCRSHDLARPEVNVAVAGFLVDFVWTERKLIVETDGYRFHRGRAAFEADRARDLALRNHGFEVVRLTYRQVLQEPQSVVSVLTCLLG